MSNLVEKECSGKSECGGDCPGRPHTSKRHKEPRHIDDFIADYKSDDYAAWVFMYFRLPAIYHSRFEKFMTDHKLFCTFEGKRWRVTGASRLGDVWLAENFNRDCGYDRRVDVDLCSEWDSKG